MTNIKKIKIFMVIRQPIGGITTYLKYTFGSMPKEKYQFTILTIENNHTKKIKEYFSGHEMNIILIKGEPVLLRFFIKIFIAFLKTDFDLVHSQGATSGALVSMVNLFKKIPHIVTFHETFDKHLINGVLSNFKTFILSFLFGRADILNVLGCHARSNLLTHFPYLRKNTEKIVLVPNGVDINYFSVDCRSNHDLYEVAGVANEDFLFGYIGRFMPEKGFPLLIDAVERMVKNDNLKNNLNYKLIIVGTGAYIREYQALIKEKGLEKKFIFMGYQHDVRWILQKLDHLVIPSLREAFGLTAVEALVSGIPVLASDCKGLSEVLKNTPSIFFKSGSADSLAQAMLNCMSHPKKQYAQEYMLEARKRYDVKNTVEKLEQLFSKMVNR